MANNEKRSSLQGFECSIFDLLGTVAPTEQWAEWLKVPLEHAAAAGDVCLVLQLQRAGANGSALHIALEGGQAALARDLVERGASVTGKDENGDSPLHLAAALGDEETVLLLLEKGAVPNVLDSADRAPLHVAAEKGRLAAVKVLLAAGADTSPRYGENDDSALDLAAAKGYVEIITALIRSGADVNATDSTGCTALHAAAYCTEVGVIDVLVEAGANVNAADDMRGWVPLHCASSRRCVVAIIALLKNGARVEEIDTNNGRSPLHLTALGGDLLAAKAFLAAGADANATDSWGDTVLHLAARGGHEDVSRVLVQAGANVNATNSLVRRNALHYAVTRPSDPGTVRVLIEAGATVEARDIDGQTPLHCCLLIIDGLEAMAVFLECGANPNAQDRYGNVPLHLAMRYLPRKDAENAVGLLLRWGADETVVNINGQTPLEVAEESLGVDGLGHLRSLLAWAPVERKWRRRGWLLLYRAYPRRMQPIPGTGAAPYDRSKKYRAGSVSTEAAGGPSAVRGGAAGAVAGGGEGVPGDWVGVVTWVVEMGLEGVFQNIVEYL